MKKRIALILVCIFLGMLAVPSSAFAEDTEAWSNEYYRAMDVTDSLADEEIKSLDERCIEILEKYHLDVAFAAITEDRLQEMNPEDFAAELYEDCDFGYGETRDGFMFLFLADTKALSVVPMGKANGLFSEDVLAYLAGDGASYYEEYGVFGVFYGCQELIVSGFDTLAAQIEEAKSQRSGDFSRCGEGSDMLRWFPENLEEAYIYFDADAPRVVDYANVISDNVEVLLSARIAQISEEIGKDIVIVTDVSNFGLGDDIYAADFYDFNGYGLGQEHEGMLLFLNFAPNDRGGWTLETGSETRAIINEEKANRLDDFLYATLATGDYDTACLDWIEDVYDLYTTGIPRAPFWYVGKNPKYTFNPKAPVVVDEWGILTREESENLRKLSDSLKEKYGISVYFHTTGDQIGLKREAYNACFMDSMGYDKNAILFSIMNTNGNTEEYMYMDCFGSAAEMIPEKFHSRIENNASAASNGYGRLLEGQRLLSVYLEKGRVPRNGFYWGMIVVLSAVIGLIAGQISLSKAESAMKTVRSSVSAFSYLDRKNTTVTKIRETFLYMTTKRVYSPPRTTSSSSGSSGGRSTYRSSYSGHSGSSHSGHGRKF